MRKILTSLFFICLISCVHDKKDTPSIKEPEEPQILADTLIGMNIDSLYTKGVVKYNSGPSAKFAEYTLVNHELADIVFDDVDINHGKSGYNFIRSVAYGTTFYVKSIDYQYKTILVALKKRYGEPDFESRANSVDNIAQYANAKWKIKDLIVFLKSVKPNYEDVGTIIVGFCIEQDKDALYVDN